jgi:low temperature requirement protein LtrA
MAVDGEVGDAPGTERAPARRWSRVLTWAMPPRDPGEEHRTSTPLELLFDLCFVVAVGQAAAELHHSLAEGRVGHGLLGYLSVFFAIWWAWMNFSWFASAYDRDDVLYRLLTLMQMTGVLVLATGVDAAFDDRDFTRVTVGYVIMRVPMTVQWLRAASGDPARRAVALRYAAGLALTQIGWVARLALPPSLGLPSFLFLVACELAVPLVAERAGPMTPWHPEHIAERYGEFTLIVLGESVLSTMVAAKASSLSWDNVLGGLGAMLLLFGVWWTYFDTPGSAGIVVSERNSWVWGYGHLPIFAAVAALGAGLSVAAEVLLHESSVSKVGAAYAVAVPLTVFLVVLTELHRRAAEGFSLAMRNQAKAVAVLAVAASALVVPLPVAILLLGGYLGLFIIDTGLAAERGR